MTLHLTERFAHFLIGWILFLADLHAAKIPGAHGEQRPGPIKIIFDISL
jgi:hypothetical protein